MKATVPGRPGHPGYPRPQSIEPAVLHHDPPADGAARDRGELAAAEALAVGGVLFRAHDAARHLENLLELEAPDPRVAELMRDAKRIRKAIAALLVDVAIEMSPEPTPEEALR